MLLIFHRVPTEDDQISHGGMCAIGLIMVQLQCLYGNPMANNFSKIEFYAIYESQR